MSAVTRRPRKFSSESQEIIDKFIKTPSYKQKNRGLTSTPLTDEMQEAVRITQNINSAIYYYKNKYQIKAKNLLKRFPYTEEQLKEYESKEDWANKFFYLLVQSKI